MSVYPAVPVAAMPTAVGRPRLYRDAFALASSSMLTALLGIAFWAVCARYIPPARLGVQAALLSIIVAPAIVVASGVGDAFTALVPVAGPARAAVVRRGYRLVLLMSGSLAVVAAGLAVTVLPQVRGSVPIALMVVAGVLVWSLYVVQDPALTSMRRAHWLPPENGSVSVAKIALLPAAIALGIAEPVVVVTLIPAAAAVAVLYPQVRRLARARPPDPPGIVVADAEHALPRLVARTTTSVGLSLGTLTVTPFLVTAAAGATQGAVFALCLSIVQSLDFVGAALGVSLVVHGAARASEAVPMAIAVFKRTVVVVGGGALVLVLIAPTVLRTLNPRYVALHAVAIVAILAGGSFTRCVYVIWAAWQRSRRTMRGLLTLNAIAATFVFCSITLCARAWGAVGAAAVVALAQVVLSAGAALNVWWTRRRGGLS